VRRPIWSARGQCFYNHDVIAAARRAGVRYSITARMSPPLSTAISSISEDQWTPISYPNAIWDDPEQRLISDAEMAEIGYLAFTSRRKADHIQARLIVRRVKRLNPTTTKPTSVGADERDGRRCRWATRHLHPQHQGLEGHSPCAVTGEAGVVRQTRGNFGSPRVPQQDRFPHLGMSHRRWHV